VTRASEPKAATGPAASERLARALRDNLRRRKRQQALRAEAEAPAMPQAPSPAQGAPGVESDGELGVPTAARRP